MTRIESIKNMKLMSAIIAGFVIMSLAFSVPLALADRGGDRDRGGDDRGRGGDNRGPGNGASAVVQGTSSGPGNSNQVQVRGRDDDDDDDEDVDEVRVNDLNDLDLDEDVDELNDVRRARGVDEPRVRLALNGSAEIRGATINSLNAGNRTLVVSVFGVQVAVDAANALIRDRDQRPITFADLRVGDSLRIQGTVSTSTTTSTVPTSVNASRIIDRSIELEDIVPPPQVPQNPDLNIIQQRINQLLALIQNLQEQIQRLLGAIGGVQDTVPPVISAFAVSGVGTSTAVASWTTNESSTSRVFVSTSTPVNPTTATVFTSAGSVISHFVNLSGLPASTTLFTVAESADAAGNVARSGEVSFTTSAADTTAPVVSGVSVSGVTSSSATIAWTTNEPATSKVFFSTSTPVNLATASVVSNAALVTSHSMTLTGLTASTTFFAVIESADAAGNVVRTDELTFITSPPPDVSAPVISAVAVSGITSSGAVISWTTNEPSTSKVFFSVSTPVNLTTASSIFNNALVTNHSITLVGLPANTTQFFVVESVDAANNVATSAEQSFATLP